MMIRILLIVLGLGLLFNASADTQPGSPPTTPAVFINTAQVAVMDESSTATQLGLQAAFADVLIKITGNPQIMTMPAAEAAANNVSQFVQSYAFSESQNNAPPAKPGVFLNVVFDKDALTALQTKLMTPTQPTKPTPAVAQTPQNNVQLAVAGIQDMDDFHLLIQTLRGIPGVLSVSTNNVSPNEVDLTVRVNGGEQTLATNLSGNLSFKPLISAANNNPSKLFYLWVRQ